LIALSIASDRLERTPPARSRHPRTPSPGRELHGRLVVELVVVDVLHAHDLGVDRVGHLAPAVPTLATEIAPDVLSMYSLPSASQSRIPSARTMTG
jgi:hypothetical protein